MSVSNRRTRDRTSAASIKASIRPVDGGLFGRLRKPQECIVLDLSRAGAGLLSTRGFDPMSEVLLSLETPDGLHAQITGTIRFTNPVDASSYRMGVHFSADANSREALATLVSIEAQLLDTADS